MTVIPEFLGVVGDTGVYRVSLAALGFSSIQSISIADSGRLGVSVGAASGFDLDFVRISPVLTNDAAAAAGVVPPASLGSSTIVFRPGFLTPVPDGSPPELTSMTLFGATPGNGGINLTTATLGTRDALAVSSVGGAVSVGVGGSIVFRFDVPIDPFGLYLYFGEVGTNEDGIVSASSSVMLPTPAWPTILGTDAADPISINAAVNAHLTNTTVFINGRGGNDLVAGAGGADRLAGGDGNDIVSGGDGFDTALFRGPRSDYRFQQQSDGSLIVQDQVAGRDGTDLLSGIENIQFANIPTFRFFHTQAGGHLFTTSAVEAASVRANLPVYRDEGMAFLTADASLVGAVPVFRFFHTQAGGHLFTTSAAEAENVRMNERVYRDEGIAFQMVAAPGEGLVPIFRFFHTQAGGHLFTSSEAEAANVRANEPVYRDEGIAFFAPTSVADQLFG